MLLRQAAWYSANSVSTAIGQVSEKWQILTLSRIETSELTATNFSTLD